MSVWTAILFGIVQGLGEFLPISSSGHLTILQNFFGLSYTEADHLLFDVMLHLGSLFAVCHTYRRDIKAMWEQTSDFLTTSGDGGKDVYGRLVPAVRMTILIFIGTLPLFLLLPFYSQIQILFGKLWFVGVAFLVTGGILYVADHIEPGKKGPKTSTVFDAILIGFGQALAVIPGLSRSGVTISLGIAQGMKRSFAVKFSFMLSIPVIVCSLLVSFVKAAFAGITWSYFPMYLFGMVISGIVSLFGIRLINLLVNKGRFGGIAYYCGFIGFVAIIASIII